ncbi:MAG TPA: response regulator [Gemmatimonadales bacterium]|nr:response regulator [Gemmatimonadales bacterium]
MSDRIPRAGLPLALLAGDAEEAMHWLTTLLESAGYALLRERSGRHALERARNTEPDVVIVEADLPDMPGAELCQLLRGDPRISGSTPILLCVGEQGSRELRLAALRAGAWECIVPPHDADEILLKIGAYVRAKLDADRARVEGLLDPVTGLYNRQGLARRARELGSQAFREHGPLACLALALDLDLEAAEPVPAEQGRVGPATAVVRCVQALKSSARLSDVIGRLSAMEFAVLAPGTDDSGARRLAERLAGTLQGNADAQPQLRVRCGYDAVANLGYAPIEPVELLVRASAALRTGKAEAGWWLRRFDGGAATAPS